MLGRDNTGSFLYQMAEHLAQLFKATEIDCLNPLEGCNTLLGKVILLKSLEWFMP